MPYSEIYKFLTILVHFQIMKLVTYVRVVVAACDAGRVMHKLSSDGNHYFVPRFKHTEECNYNPCSICQLVPQGMEKELIAPPPTFFVPIFTRYDNVAFRSNKKIKSMGKNCCAINMECEVVNKISEDIPAQGSQMELFKLPVTHAQARTITPFKLYFCYPFPPPFASHSRGK